MELTIITITRVDVNYSLQILDSFINSKKCLYKDLEALQESTKYNTFYMKVSHADVVKVYDASVWPEGILVRKFYPCRR